MKKTMLAAVVLLSMSACTLQSKAKTTVEGAGFTEVVIRSEQAQGWPCKQKEQTHVVFNGRDMRGFMKDGVVCCDGSFFGSCAIATP